MKIRMLEGGPLDSAARPLDHGKATIYVEKIRADRRPSMCAIATCATKTAW